MTSKTTRILGTIANVMKQRVSVCLVASSLLLGLPSGAFSDSGTLTTFDVLGSVHTVVMSINEEGAIAGFFVDPNPTSRGAWRGFLRGKQGTINTFAPPGAGIGPFDRTFALSINEEGAIAGYHLGVDGEHGFVRDRHGTFTKIDVPGASSTAAGSINEEGAIAGSYSDALGTPWVCA